MSKALPKFVVIEETGEFGRRAFGPYNSFREAAGEALQMKNAYVLHLEKPSTTATAVPVE